MPSNQTSNYKLSQWAKSDRVLMEDFNADNAKIDAAMKAEADTRAAAVQAVAVTVPKIAVGTYTGTGTASRSISVGFRPKAVLIMREDGATHHDSSGSGYCYGGLILDGFPIQITPSASGSTPLTCAEIYSSGFRVCYIGDNYTSAHPFPNYKGFVFHYIAIG